MTADRPRNPCLLAMAAGTWAVITELERAGCRVVGAHVLPQAAVRIDRAPGWIETYGYRQPLPGTRPGAVEHIAYRHGVRVTWYAQMGRRDPDLDGGYA